MTDCECLSGCPFFNDKMASMPTMAEMYKQKYCKTDSRGCARFVVFKQLGKAAVPADLYPNDMDRANEVLAQA